MALSLLSRSRASRWSDAKKPKEGEMKRFISGSQGACVNQRETKQAHRLLLAAAMSLSLGIIPAAAATRSSVQEEHSSGGRVAVFEKPGSASGVTDVVPFPGVVERDVEKHEIRASFDPAPQAVVQLGSRALTITRR